jgi:hypothetical protein
MSRVTCTERVGGGLVAVVHGRGSGLTWGLSELQRERCARLFGREGREEGWSSRWSASVSIQSGVVGGGWVSPKGADRWGCRVGWVQILAWRVVERKERGGRGYWQDLACLGSGLPFPFFIFENLINFGLG